MKLKTLSLAVASAIAVGAAAQASAAYFEPYQVTGSEVTLHLGGSTAQDPGIILLMRRMCSAGTMTRVATSTGGGAGSSAILCEANGTDTPGIPAGTKLVLYKNSTGGSGNGVGAVANGTTLPFLNLAAYTATQYTASTLCSVSTTGSTADFADYKNYACSALPSANVIPDFGISDVEPQLLGYTAADGALKVQAGPQVIFGVPVSKNFRDALQAAQGKTVGSPEEADMPSLSKAVIASILNGSLLQVTQLSDKNGNKLTAPSGSPLFSICRRKPGSGTLASFNAYFLNAGCAANVKAISGGNNPVDGDAAIPSVAASTNAYGGTPQVIGCLNANHAANKYAIGMAGMEVRVGSAYTNTNLGGDGSPFDDDTGNWGWVKINGYAPTLLNVVQGKYDLAYEATYQYRDAGNPHGALTGTPQTFANLVVSTNGSAPVIKELLAGFRQNTGGTTPWDTGLLGKPGTPTLPSASPAGVLTAAEVVANPVNTWTRAPSGTPNSCQPATITNKETGLDYSNGAF